MLTTRYGVRGRVIAGAATAVLAAAAPALPAAAAQTLTIAAQADAGTMDPQAQNINTTLSLLSMIYEPLVTRDRDLAKAPGLATSWEIVEPTRWRFHLRPDVKFQDGSAFGADDVVFTIGRAKADTSQFTVFVGSIAEAKAVDDHTVEITTNGPDPLLADKLTQIFIMDRAWAEAHGVTKPQDLKKGEETYTTLHANGTGPFALSRREPDSRTVLTRNDAYWGKLADPDLGEVVFTPIANDPTRVAALISGEVDLLIDVPSQDVARLRQDPNLKVETSNEFRTLFFGFDEGSDTLKYGDPALKKNPFKDERVREAINHAIDMEAIVSAVMRGFATPTGQILAPGNVGYDSALDQRVSYDPAKAKALLAEAGYPDGFAFTLDCPNDRYVNDEGICRAVTAMLTQIGLEPTLNLMPRAKYFPKLWERDTSMFLMGFNSPYFDGMYALSTLLMTRDDKAGEGIYNYAQYSNPDLDAKIRAARDETDLDKRAQMMKDVYRTITEADIYVPLHHQMLVYAMRKDVDAVVRPDNQLEIRWVTKS